MIAKKIINGTYEMAALFFSVNVRMVYGHSVRQTLIQFGRCLWNTVGLHITMPTITTSSFKVNDWSSLPKNNNTCMLIAETVSKSAVISVPWWGQNITTRTN